MSEHNWVTIYLILAVLATVFFLGSAATARRGDTIAKMRLMPLGLMFLATIEVIQFSHRL